MSIQMSSPISDPPNFSSALQQLSSLLTLSQEIRASSESGHPLTSSDLISKLDTLLPPPSPASSGTPSTPSKSPGDLAISADSGLAMTASFSSLCESDASVFSPFPHSRSRRSSRSPSLRTPPHKTRPHQPSEAPLSPREEEISTFLQTVSSEFCSSLRALLSIMSREGDTRPDEITGSCSDVTLPELEPREKDRERVSEDVNQLRERNAYLLNACKELKARVREERREGKRVRKENTSLSLERGGLLSKMSETEREIIEKMAEHSSLMEAYSQLEERLKERERNVRDTHAQIAAMEVEVNKLNALLSRMEEELSESRLREEERQRENSHLREELAVQEREVLELRSAAERVHSQARLLSTMEDTVPSPPNTYTVGLVSTDKILQEAGSLYDQLNKLTELFAADPSHCLSQIRSGLTHALADGNILLQDVTALKNEHEHCKDALFQLQGAEKGYTVSSHPDGSLDLLRMIAEMAPRIKLEAEMLAEQWNQMEVSDAARNDAMLMSHLREILAEHLEGEVPESLLTSLTSLLSTRQREGGSEGTELEGILQESSLLLNTMSEALTSEQLRRQSQVRALKKRTQRDTSTLKRIQLECEQAVRGQGALRQSLSRLLENLCEAESCEVRLCQGVVEESVKQVAERMERVLLAGYNRKIATLKERLATAYNHGRETRQLLEGKLYENEALSAEVREIRMCRVKLEGDNRELERQMERLHQLVSSEREESATREQLLATKLSILQEHIQQYDNVMFQELDRLSVQVRDDGDNQLWRQEEGEEVLNGLREQLAERDDQVEYLEREITIYKMKLLELEKKCIQTDTANKCIEETSVEMESKKKVHFSENLPSPSPYSLPPIVPLKGEALQTALGVALSQEKFYARAHLSLQTERDQLAEENKQLRDKLNSMHQRISDPLGLIPSRPSSSLSPSSSSPPTDTQEHPPSDRRLELENSSLTRQLTEQNFRLTRLENYRSLYLDSKNKIKSLLWQKSYLKSQLNVYFSSLRASALILNDLGVGVDKIGNQPNFIYLDYTPANTDYSPFFRF